VELHYGLDGAPGRTFPPPDRGSLRPRCARRLRDGFGDATAVSPGVVKPHWPRGQHRSATQRTLRSLCATVTPAGRWLANRERPPTRMRHRLSAAGRMPKRPGSGCATRR